MQFLIFFLTFYAAITSFIFSNISLIPHVPIEKEPYIWGKIGLKLPYLGDHQKLVTLFELVPDWLEQLQGNNILSNIQYLILKELTQQLLL